MLHFTFQDLTIQKFHITFHGGSKWTLTKVVQICSDGFHLGMNLVSSEAWGDGNCLTFEGYYLGCIPATIDRSSLEPSIYIYIYIININI